MKITLLNGCTEKHRMLDIFSMVVLKLKEYTHALRNPLKGFRPRKRDGSHEYGTLCRTYLKWNLLERCEEDGIERILKVCDEEWRNVESYNIKVVPRVYLHWDGDETYWPTDMRTGDYTSKQFQERLVRLVKRLGECWNQDARVAWIQMGIVGKWGEHHSPRLSPQFQTLLGDIFSQTFVQKLVTVRHPWDFRSRLVTDSVPGNLKYYQFGIHWDSWAHISQMKSHGFGIESLGDRWKTHPIEGECSYNWGRYREQPGDNPDDTLRDANHRDYLINSIRKLHCNNLGWVAEYDSSDLDVRLGAERVQKALGYRFIINEFDYPVTIERDMPFEVSFTVYNAGSTPFYFNWPVELSLLKPQENSVVWSSLFEGLDIRQWLPGSNWDERRKVYINAAEIHTVRRLFSVPYNMDVGEYILAVSILDPSGMLSSVRFAIQNYWHGGHHPIGRIGVETFVENPVIASDSFIDLAQDTSLYYQK